VKAQCERARIEAISFSFRFENALTRFKASSRVTFSLLGLSIFTRLLKGFIGNLRSDYVRGAHRSQAFMRLALGWLSARQVESVRMRELQFASLTPVVCLVECH